MPKVNELYGKLKKIVGCSYESIANEFGVSKQHVHQTFCNTSMTYENSAKFMALCMVDLKISEYKAEIEKLENFKKEITNENRIDRC